MIDFEFSLPTRIYFGRGKEKELASILNKGSWRRVMLILGRGSVKASPLFDTVLQQMEKAGVTYSVLEGVRPNPTISLVLKGIERAKEFHPDLLLAVGGGSVIDTAKSISVGYYYDGNPFDFNLHKAVPEKALPIGVILTIAAAGSECSNSCVIQDDATGKKSGFNSDIVRPVFAIENPELTYTVPEMQTKYGIVDMFMHTLERYLQKSADNEPADGFAESVLRSVLKAARSVLKTPNDYEARSVLMCMSSFAHNDLTNLGKKKAMPVHALEHAVSGVYPSVTHAAGLAVLWPSWAKYYFDHDVDIEKFAKLAKNVFGREDRDLHEAALSGIQEVKNFFSELGMPKTLRELGVQEKDISRLVNVLTDNGTRSVYHHSNPIDAEQAEIIYRNCF